MPDLMDLDYEGLEFFGAKKSDFPFTDEQLQCIEVRSSPKFSPAILYFLSVNCEITCNYLCKQDKADEGAAANPDLKEWITNTKKSGFELLERVRGCYEKTGLKRKLVPSAKTTFIQSRNLTNVQS